MNIPWTFCWRTPVACLLCSCFIKWGGRLRENWPDDDGAKMFWLQFSEKQSRWRTRLSRWLPKLLNFLSVIHFRRWSLARKQNENDKGWIEENKKTLHGENNVGEDKAKTDINPLSSKPASNLSRASPPTKRPKVFSSTFPPSHLLDACLCCKASESEKCVDDLKKGLWHDGEKKVKRSERNKLFHWHSSRSQPIAFMRSNVLFVFLLHLYSCVGLMWKAAGIIMLPHRMNVVGLPKKHNSDLTSWNFKWKSKSKSDFVVRQPFPHNLLSSSFSSS